jgi:hypothetical protein
MVSRGALHVRHRRCTSCLLDAVSHRPYPPSMPSVSDFAAFFAEHEHCRVLDGSSIDNGNRVVLTCSCGAIFSRLVRDLHPEDRCDAQFRRGLNCARSENYPAAVQSYRVAALQSHTNAQNNLGVLYPRGTGVPQDYVQATKWFRRAADNGLAGAQFNLARLYTFGHGVQQSDAEAVKWFRRAAAEERRSDCAT